MTDKSLAERALAGSKLFHRDGHLADLLRECANEIERLREALEKIAVRKWPNADLIQFALTALGLTKADIQALEEKYK